MDRMIYLSMSGAKATMQRQETLAHNLANVSTSGFRAELQAFRAVPVQGSGAASRVYTLESTPGYDATPGTVSATGRNLDVAFGIGLAGQVAAERRLQRAAGIGMMFLQRHPDEADLAVTRACR